MKITYRTVVQRDMPRFSLKSEYATKLKVRSGDIVHVEKIEIGKVKVLRPGGVKLTSGLEVYVKGTDGKQLPRGKMVSVTISN